MNPVADANASPVNPSPSTPSSSKDKSADEEYEYISNPYRYVFAGIVFFVIPSVVFVLAGGLRWLKRITGRDMGRGSKGGRYAMVKDLEK
ncbi:hypothetical protein FRC03_009159 [Tulasnella sp. 419]|nr:hypothetical protein FRC03_009159 [Tulasnella sp. 419]